MPAAQAREKPRGSRGRHHAGFFLRGCRGPHHAQTSARVKPNGGRGNRQAGRATGYWRHGIRLHRRRRRFGRGAVVAKPAVGRPAPHGAACSKPGRRPSLDRIPVGYSRLITNPAVNWLYSFRAEASTNGRRIPVPRGKLLAAPAPSTPRLRAARRRTSTPGAQMGNPGWAYEDVLPFFKRMESYPEGRRALSRPLGPAEGGHQSAAAQSALCDGDQGRRRGRIPAQSRLQRRGRRTASP